MIDIEKAITEISDLTLWLNWASRKDNLNQIVKVSAALVKAIKEYNEVMEMYHIKKYIPSMNKTELNHFYIKYIRAMAFYEYSAHPADIALKAALSCAIEDLQIALAK